MTLENLLKIDFLNMKSLLLNAHDSSLLFFDFVYGTGGGGERCCLCWSSNLMLIGLFYD